MHQCPIRTGCRGRCKHWPLDSFAAAIRSGRALSEKSGRYRDGGWYGRWRVVLSCRHPHVRLQGRVARVVYGPRQARHLAHRSRLAAAKHHAHVRRHGAQRQSARRSDANSGRRGSHRSGGLARGELGRRRGGEPLGPRDPRHEHPGDRLRFQESCAWRPMWCARSFSRTSISWITFTAEPRARSVAC